MYRNQMEASTLQSAWENINEYLFINTEDVKKTGGGLYGPEWVSYNNCVLIRRAWVDPDFDFGRKLGYNIRKWSSLVNNYIDFKYLDMIRAEISLRVEKRARNYNYTYHFDNSHGSGKDCLISVSFTKRIYQETPVLVFAVRTSEVTKRLLFDFLLVQRLAEYVYGHNDVEVDFMASSMYITIDSFNMYNNHRDITKMVEGKELSEHQRKIMNRFKFYMEHDNPEEIKYRVNKRVAMQIKKDEETNLPLSGVKPMLAGSLTLNKPEIHYPENVISRTQRRIWNKKAKTCYKDN